VGPAGGRIIVPKTLISAEAGYYAFLVDTEGNRIALHSMH
jgi:predicted enzyme related to lactoylglutathione lyase